MLIRSDTQFVDLTQVQAQMTICTQRRTNEECEQMQLPLLLLRLVVFRLRLRLREIISVQLCCRAGDFLHVTRYGVAGEAGRSSSMIWRPVAIGTSKWAAPATRSSWCK